MLADLPLGERQVESIRDSTARVCVWEGSIRSGKTIASLLRWLIYVASAPQGGALVVIARTRDSAARNVFGPLTDEALFGPIARQVKYTAGAPSAVILGRVVYVLGASDAKAEKVLRGLTVAGAYVDEATVIPEEFFTQLLGRMSVPGAQLFATTNPDNPAHWLKRKFLDRIGDLPDWRRFHFTLPDNPSLTAEYVASISREYTGLWYRRFILGEWVAAEGAIYDMWDPERHVVRDEDLPWIKRWLAAGIDYGDVHPFSALLLGIGEDDRLYVTSEWRYDSTLARRLMTQPEYSQAVRSWLQAQRRPGERLAAVGVMPEWIYVDSAAAGFRNQLYVDGLANVTGADKAVVDGIRSVAGLFAKDRLRIAASCEGLLTEIPGYSWDDKAALRGEDAPVKTADDSCDALRYAVHSTAWIWQQHLLEGAA